MKRIIELTIKYYSGNINVRSELRELKLYENLWYKSLAEGKPNYNLYDEIYMLADYYACFVCYSNKYLKLLSKPNTLLNGKSICDDIVTNNAIVDLGCGISYTTIKLKTMFPDNSLYGTNIKNSLQYKYGKFLQKSNKINIIAETAEINEKVGVIFASEYFEHIFSPIEHLKNILLLEPKYLIIANSFSAVSMGHFPYYNFNGQNISNKKIGRLFNNALRENGYIKTKTTLWNGRPNYWKHKSIL